MSRLNRRAVLASMGLLVTSGCVSRSRPGRTDGDPSPSGHRTDTPSPNDGSPSRNGITPGAAEPRADHAIFLANRDTRTRAVRIEVVRERSGAVVFDEILTVSPGTEREVYNLERASPEGIEAFMICARATSSTSEPDPTPTTSDSAARNCITMQTDSCYGTAHVTAQANGELDIIYSIC